MKRLNIFINATAATESGALIILKQLYEAIKDYANTNNRYYIFCSVNLAADNVGHIKIVNDIKAKKIFHRIYWELFGLKKWSKKNKIYADVIISLQNTGFRYFSMTKKIVYLHQSIPFEKKVKWNIFNPFQRKSWFYKHIYFRLIK